MCDGKKTQYELTYCVFLPSHRLAEDENYSLPVFSAFSSSSSASLDTIPAF